MKKFLLLLFSLQISKYIFTAASLAGGLDEAVAILDKAPAIKERTFLLADKEIKIKSDLFDFSTVLQDFVERFPGESVIDLNDLKELAALKVDLEALKALLETVKNKKWLKYSTDNDFKQLLIMLDVANFLNLKDGDLDIAKDILSDCIVQKTVLAEATGKEVTARKLVDPQLEKVLLKKFEGKKFKIAKAADAVTWSPDGRFLALTNPESCLVLSSATGERVRRFNIKDAVRVSWSSKHKLALGQKDGTIIISDNLLEKLEVKFKGGSKVVNHLAWNPAGDQLAFVAGDDQLKIYSQGRVLPFPPLKKTIFSIAWSPDGSKIAAGVEGSITIYDNYGKILVSDLKISSFPSLVFSPDGTSIASIDSTAISIWNILTKKVFKIFDTKIRLTELAWKDNGITTLSAEGSIVIWNPINGNQVKEMASGLGNMSRFEWDNKGEQLLVLREDGSLSLFYNHSAQELFDKMYKLAAIKEVPSMVAVPRLRPSRPALPKAPSAFASAAADSSKE